MKIIKHVILAAILPLSGFVAADPGAAVKVGTYNIRLSGVGGRADKGTPNAWIDRKEDIVKLIRELDLDVFGLQEVCPDQAGFLRNNLEGYEFVGEHRNADRVSGEASPVCFRKSRFEALGKGTFWLSETPDTPGLKGWGAACPRVCSYLILRDRRTGRRFCFANTHTDHVSAEAREKGMLLVVERMKKFGAGVPIVFTGDHNCRETEAPAKAVAAILKDALYESQTPPKGPWRTFSGWKWLENEVAAVEALKVPVDIRNAKKGSPDGVKIVSGVHPHEKCGARIDYIYVSPGVKVLDFETVNRPRAGRELYPSDHFPVVATVEF